MVDTQSEIRLAFSEFPE